MIRMDNVTRTWAWIILGVVIVAAVLWWLYSSPGTTTLQPVAPATSIETTGTSGGTAAAPLEATVTYNGTTFSPKEAVVAEGGTVTFKNEGGGRMWIASAPHPTHEGYGGAPRSRHCPDTADVAFDQCAAGTAYSFTFRKTGTWRYHDHLNPNASGTVTVSR